MPERDEDEIVIDRLVVDLPETGSDEELGTAIARALMARFAELMEEG